jgi:hypothetical protein
MDTSKNPLCDCNPCTCTNCACGTTASPEPKGCACGAQCGCGDACTCGQA